MTHGPDPFAVARMGGASIGNLGERKSLTDTSISDAIIANEDWVQAGHSVARLSVSKRDGATVLQCSGVWTCEGINAVDDVLREIAIADAQAITMDMSLVRGFDSSGAWLVDRTRRLADDAGIPFRFIPAKDGHEKLVSVIAEHDIAIGTSVHMPQGRLGAIEFVGKSVFSFGRDFVDVCNMIGASLRGTAIKTGAKGGIRVTPLINQIDHMAIRAIPVIAVMSFLIGAIIAQQSAYLLRDFGEELLTINLVGILHLREIGVLLTAVMVAGRSGSAITAEIGSMKMREEIDALRVIGLNPIGILVVPRLLALIIAVPILTLLADLAGLFGALIVCWLYIGIEPVQFIATLQTAIDQSTLLSGLIKAPFMALVIGLIATLEGLKVQGSAESLGQRTTSSVVRSIFAVIFIDGIFALFYASIGY